MLLVTALVASCQPSRPRAAAPMPSSAPVVAGRAAPPATSPAAPPTSAPPTSAAPMIALGGDRYLAVVSVAGRVDECTGAGGEHYTFAVDGASTLLHGGGHAVYLNLVPSWGPLPDAWFVAELARVPDPGTSVVGSCVALPSIGGEVLRLVPAADRDDARRLLTEVSATGLPRAQVTIGAPAAADALALVRVRHRLGNGDLAVDAVVGAAPSTIAVRELDAWTGDLLVIAVAGGAATRALLADDLADARRWHARIIADGWPPEARAIPWASAASVTRWTAVARRGWDRRCGAELRFGAGDSSPFSLPPGRAALPAGVGAIGSELAVVLVPQPADACGRTVRVVRAYPSDPRGSRWIGWGQPAAAAAVVE